MVIAAAMLCASVGIAQAQARPSLVSAAGTIASGDHALVVTLDGQVLLPALMLGYRYGAADWLELGIDVGASVGLFQSFAQAKAAIYRSPGERIFVGARLYSGYKIHDYEIGSIIADDNSWGSAIEPSLAVRFGDRKRRALYFSALFYVDFDLRSPRRQTDLYLLPAIVGFESLIGTRFNFYVEAGLALSLNGTETPKGVLYAGDAFPVVKAGLAWRIP